MISSISEANLELRARLVQRDNKIKSLTKEVQLLRTAILTKDDQLKKLKQTVLLQRQQFSHASASLTSLPFECREILISFLQFIDYGRCCNVSKTWNSCCTESEVWFREYYRYWDPESRTKSVTQSLKIAPCRRSGPNNTWKHKCQERAKIETKWDTGRPLVTTLTGHQGTVTCLGMVEVEALTPTQKRSECSMRRMVSGSDDGSLILWTAKIKSKDTTNNNNILYQQHHRQAGTSRRIRAFQGHGGPVWTLHIHGNSLFSGSYDKTVKMWNINTGECLKTLRGHTGWVSSLDMTSTKEDNRLISGSWDATVNIWNPITGILLKTIPPVNNSDAVYCLKIDCANTRHVAIGGRLPDVHVIDIEQQQSLRQSLRIFKGHCKSVNSLHMDRSCEYGRLVTGSSDKTVKVWDDRSTNCVGTFRHGDAVMAVVQEGYKVISGCYDKTIRIFDLRRLSESKQMNSSCEVRKLAVHSDAVFSLMIDYENNSITSGSADHTIKTISF